MNRPDHRTPKQPWLRSVAGSCGVLAACILLLGSTPKAAAQSDNFDSGTLSPNWQQLAINPALYSLTFPTFGTGKALRIQGNPYPPASFPAAVGLFQTNLYTDFYEAVDLVNWVVEDQAVVLWGRFTPGGATGLDGGSGVIFNYDVAQDGETAGDRNGGEIQINTLQPGFATSTKAACEMTLVPGHSYRFVFKCVGQVYTGQIYDWNDLTSPLVTVQFTDTAATFTSGECGLLSFSRNGIVGTTDVTIDNYYAAATDPNLATPPALMHPVPGTPVVETRVPAGRWQNFYNPASGISLTAKTHTADVINSSATKLLLNGVDVSSQLTLTPSGGGTILTGSLPGSALKANSVYSAQVSLADTTGLKTSVNTFWFDTFSDAYLASAAVKTIECEDYNYSNAVHQLDPIPVSGLPIITPPFQVNGDGVGYYDGGTPAWMTKGVEGVDFHCANLSPDGGWDEYRPNEGVRTGEGIRQEIEDELHPDVSGITPLNPWDAFFNIYDRPNDNTRQKYAVSNLVEYLVIRTQPADWLNYTRSFDSSTTNYFAFLRAGALDPIAVTLSKVTSDPSQTNQTTSDYGTFSIPNTVRRSNFSYVSLLDANGAAPVLGLSGANTLRLTVGGTVTKDNRVEVLNYLLLVPAQVALQSASVVTGPYADELTATINVNARSVSITAAGAPRFYRLLAPAPVKISSISASGGTVTIKY